jgi:hypothetical protein
MGRVVLGCPCGLRPGLGSGRRGSAKSQLGVSTLSRAVEALLFLVGVVVAALLGGAVGWFLRRARDRRATCAAALLVRDEMRQIWGILDVQVRNASFGSVLGTSVGPSAQVWESLTRQWQAQRDALAAGLAPEVWQYVADAYRGLGRVQTLRTISGVREVGPAERSDVFVRARDHFGMAMNTLERNAGLSETKLRPSRRPGAARPRRRRS